MHLNFNFLNGLIFTGCLQGIILGILILVRKGKSRAALFLSFLVIAYSMDTLFAVFFDTGLSWQEPWLLISPLSLILGIGPFLYLHVYFTVNPAAGLRKKDYLHFLPVFLEFSWYAGLSVYYWGRPQAIRDFYRIYESTYSLPEQLAGIISVFIYLVITLRLLNVNGQRIRSNFSRTEGRVYSRLNRLTILLGVGWLIWLVLILIDAGIYGFSLGEYVYYPLYLLMSATIYAIGYSGYFEKTVIEKIAVKSEAVTLEEIEISDPDLAVIADRAKKIMENDKLYLDNDLRLKSVAHAVGVVPGRLSIAIKLDTKKSFYDFVNHYRVEEVKGRLADPAYNNVTLLSIAFDCGFNSKSTFNEIFKKQTGKTPKQFKTAAQNNVRIINPDFPKPSLH